MASLTVDLADKGYSLYPNATKAGQSTGIRARVSFKYQTTFAGAAATSYATIYENLKIKFVKDDPKNKRMQVKYSWSKTTA